MNKVQHVNRAQVQLTSSVLFTLSNRMFRLIACLAPDATHVNVLSP